MMQALAEGAAVLAADMTETRFCAYQGCSVLAPSSPGGLVPRVKGRHRFMCAYPGKAAPMKSGTWQGAAAGAAGTTALNAATSVAMAVRERPASDALRQSVERAADRAATRYTRE